jgi:3-hydroxyacyl-[acyl-carrier-protein] dehydratase
VHWRFLERITKLSDKSAEAIARTDLPATLFADHFPGFPITPGVLLVEMCAQLGGRLVEIRCSQSAGRLLLPVLTIVRDAKFHGFVPPGRELRITAEFEHVRPESALCLCEVFDGDRRVALARLMFAFDHTGESKGIQRDLVEAFERSEFERLGLAGFPPGPVSAAFCYS